MQFLAPDILEAARQVSLGVSGSGCAIGLLLWLTGWYGHRFWIVLGATVIAGVAGLLLGPAHGMKPLVAGLLFAIAAGVLALALVRVIVFAAGGAAVCVACRGLLPAAWDGPVACFLVGGLVALLLFRLWTMALTSLAGTTVMAYSLLCLLDRLGKVNAVSWAEQNGPMANGVCLGVAALGVAMQFMLERRRLRKLRWKEEAERHITEKERERLYRKRSWFDRHHDYRRAG